MNFGLKMALAILFWVAAAGFGCRYQQEAPVRALWVEAAEAASRIEKIRIEPRPDTLTEGQIRVLVSPDEIVVDPTAWMDAVHPGTPEWDEVRRAQTLQHIPLHQGRIDEAERRGQLISPFYMTMLELAEAHKDLAMQTGREDLEFKGRLQILADKSIPYETMRQVLFTAGQAQFSKFEFEVEGGGVYLVWGDNGRIPIELHGDTGAWLSASDRGAHAATRVSGDDALIAAVERIREHLPERQDTVIFPGDAVPWARLVRLSTRLNRRPELAMLGGVGGDRTPGRFFDDVDAMLRALGPAHAARLDHPERLARIHVGAIQARTDALSTLADLDAARLNGQPPRIRGPILDCAVLHLGHIDGQGVVRIDTRRGAPAVSTSGSLGSPFETCVSDALRDPANGLHSIRPDRRRSMWNMGARLPERGLSATLEVDVRAGSGRERVRGSDGLLERGRAMQTTPPEAAQLDQILDESPLELERLWAQAIRIREARTLPALTHVLDTGPRSPALRVATNRRVGALVPRLEDQIALLGDLPALTEAVSGTIGQATAAELTGVMLTARRSETRRTATGLLSARCSEPSARQALIDALDAERHRSPPWAPGALFLPRADFSNAEARELFHSLTRFTLRDPQVSAQVDNAVRGTALAHAAGYRCVGGGVSWVRDCLPPDELKAMKAEESP